jgi:glucosamine 6-phosphate synthetase-like amidotransferase/phosphosugar isomerase protein
VTWQFGTAPDGLAGEVQATGARFEHRAIDPLADLVRLHRTALDRAVVRGLDPDQPRNLTRSVILDA